MERLGRIFGLALLLLAAVPVQAQQLPSAGTQRQAPVVVVPKPVIDAASRCGVFAPPSLAQPFPHLRWSGACRDGLAEGRGTASFAATSTAAAHKIWQGNFCNGFFLGEASVPGAIIAISSYLAGIELLHTAPQEGRVWLRSTMAGEAGRSLGRQKLPNTITNAEISAIAATSWKLCRDPACLDYVLWMEEEKSFAWGADQSQFLK